MRSNDSMRSKRLSDLMRSRDSTRSSDSVRSRDDSLSRSLPVASPAHMLPVQVIHREVIAPDVVSLFIVLPGTQQAPAPYRPGQFVTLALPTRRDTLYRSYSLCGDGDVKQPWELTVKRIEMGAVSTHFYNSVREGTLLYASLPRGTFTLPKDLQPESALMMIAMGSGITPIMGMLRALARKPPEERPLVQLHYASRSEDDIIFGAELDDMDPDQTWLRQRHYLSSEGNRMTVDDVVAAAGRLARRAHWYVCGAESLKRELQARLDQLGVPERQVHSEVFATQSVRPAYRLGDQADSGVGGIMQILETGASLEVLPQETLLVALERHGYRPEFSCRGGTCGTCKLRVVEGQVDPVGEALSPSERAAGYVLSCIAHPIGDITLASGGKPPAGVARVAAVGGAPSRAGAVALTRVAAAMGVGVLLLGSWNLTDHRPVSWAAQAVASASDQTPESITPTSVLPSGGAQPTATTHAGTGGGAQPTATTHAGTGGGAQPTATSGSGGGAQPTVTPKPNPTPKPTPTCHSTPSKPC